VEQKTEVLHLAEALAFAGGFAGTFAGLQRGESVDQTGEDGRRSDGDIVLAEYSFHLM
jgi:hypothetical protein